MGQGPGEERGQGLIWGIIILEGEKSWGKKGRKGAGKERLGENLGPLVPLPQTKIKTRILKGDLITQSQGWGKGWAGGHCLPLLKSPFLYIHRRSGDNGVLGSSSQNLKVGSLCKTPPPPYPTLQIFRFVGIWPV